MSQGHLIVFAGILSVFVSILAVSWKFKVSWDTRFAAGTLISVYLLVFDGVLFVFDGTLSVFVSIFELEIPSVMFFFLVFWSYFVMFSFCLVAFWVIC